MSPLPSLRSFLQENRFFFFAFFLFLIVGAGLLWWLPQAELIFFFSDHRRPWLDQFFRMATRLGEALPFVAAVVVLLFRRYRYVFALLILSLLVSLTSFMSKTFFAHLRPYAYIEQMGQLERLCLVDGVSVHMAATSFPSGHTMAAFALYGFLAFLVPRKGLPGLFFFMLALVVGVSRIYLVQHFLKDVYLGALLGVVLAMTVYFLQAGYPSSPHRWLDKSLLQKFR